MLELLSPAGSPESVIAAVQNGADAVYMGLGNFNARRNAANFSLEEFEKAVRYCRVRGCKVYVTMNTLIGDREMKEAAELACRVSDIGADAILVQDLGLLSVLKRTVPDIPLHASTQMSIHSLAGAEAAAEMGLSRVVLARELSFEQIKFITKNSPVETEIFVHGALCFCHSGQCYMSSLIGRRSGNRGMCAQPCRLEYTMGQRLEDTHPLSLKDNCLADRLAEIEDAGVACVKIEGRMKRPEYTAIVTEIYSKVIKEHRPPTQEEIKRLETAFSRQGFTQGYFDGDRSDMFGVREEPGRENERLFSAVRRAYSEGELRRVPVTVYAVADREKGFRGAAFDGEGNHVTVNGKKPAEAEHVESTEDALNEQLFKTGGTPYYCREVQSRIEPGLYIPSSAVNELRRGLLSGLSEKRAAPPGRRSFPLPEAPKTCGQTADPVTIYQVRTLDQLSPGLAALKPAYIYVPLTELYTDIGPAKPFLDAGTKLVAVMPRVITDTEERQILVMLEKVFDAGVSEVLAGNIGHVRLAKRAGMKVRADFGMNVFNSYSLDTVRQMGCLSATASFEMRIAQVKDMAKSMDTELIVYGRLPLMVSDQCIISRSAGGKCSCLTQNQLSDRKGSVFPVVREFDHRNVIYNAHKLFLADKPEDMYSAGLWGIRLMFTTENARECVEVAKRYRGENDYSPNVLTRGLYYRGVD